jgi:hypothetical protein
LGCSEILYVGKASFQGAGAGENEIVFSVIFMIA